MLSLPIALVPVDGESIVFLNFKSKERNKGTNPANPDSHGQIPVQALCSHQATRGLCLYHGTQPLTSSFVQSNESWSLNWSLTVTHKWCWVASVPLVIKTHWFYLLDVSPRHLLLFFNNGIATIQDPASCHLHDWKSFLIHRCLFLSEAGWIVRATISEEWLGARNWATCFVSVTSYNLHHDPVMYVL